MMSPLKMKTQCVVVVVFLNTGLGGCEFSLREIWGWGALSARESAA